MATLILLRLRNSDKVPGTRSSGGPLRTGYVTFRLGLYAHQRVPRGRTCSPGFNTR